MICICAQFVDNFMAAPDSDSYHMGPNSGTDDPSSCGYTLTLIMAVSAAVSNAALLRCMTAEQTVGGIITSLSSIALGVTTLVFVWDRTSVLHANYADYDNTFKPAHGPLFGAAGAHSILLISYCWLFSLTLNIVSCLAALRICMLNKLYPDMAKQRGDFRAAVLSVSLGGGLAASWSDSSPEATEPTFSLEQGHNEL